MGVDIGVVNGSAVEDIVKLVEEHWRPGVGQRPSAVETGKGADIAGVRGTYWGAYNALSEYLNYTKGRNGNNRMDSLWFGQNKTMSQKALDTALELTS